MPTMREVGLDSPYVRANKVEGGTIREEGGG